MNGSLSHFLNYFSVMEPSSPFFENLPVNSLFDPFGSPSRGQKPSLPLKKEFFRKSPRPSLPLKRAPPLTPTLSPSGEREETAPPRRSEPLRSKVGGASKPSPCCAGWDRRGRREFIVNSLQLIFGGFDNKLQIYCEFLVFKNMFIGIAQLMGYANEFTSQGCFYTSNGLSREVMSAC